MIDCRFISFKSIQELPTTVATIVIYGILFVPKQNIKAEPWMTTSWKFKTACCSGCYRHLAPVRWRAPDNFREHGSCETSQSELIVVKRSLHVECFRLFCKCEAGPLETCTEWSSAQCQQARVLYTFHVVIDAAGTVNAVTNRCNNNTSVNSVQFVLMSLMRVEWCQFTEFESLSDATKLCHFPGIVNWSCTEFMAFFLVDLWSMVVFNSSTYYKVLSYLWLT